MRQTKYNLYARFYTDDDVMLTYNGWDYGFYGDTLEIIEQFDTHEDAINELKKIRVHDGHKASEFTRDFLNRFIASPSEEVSYSGNQEYDIRLNEITVLKEEYDEDDDGDLYDEHEFLETSIEEPFSSTNDFEAEMEKEINKLKDRLDLFEALTKKNHDELCQEFCEEQELRGQLQEEVEQRIDALDSKMDNLCGRVSDHHGKIGVLEREQADTEGALSKHAELFISDSDQFEALEKRIAELEQCKTFQEQQNIGVSEALRKLEEAHNALCDVVQYVIQDKVWENGTISQLMKQARLPQEAQDDKTSVSNDVADVRVDTDGDSSNGGDVISVVDVDEIMEEIRESANNNQFINGYALAFKRMILNAIDGLVRPHIERLVGERDEAVEELRVKKISWRSTDGHMKAVIRQRDETITRISAERDTLNEENNKLSDLNLQQSSDIIDLQYKLSKTLKER